ncbi:RHS repeat domain-containing protein [Rugamonas sp. CCM 8940]|uniref:RHS repeat domain-containing protein n=1 Tax=Rugamonas sp. CCM 8940 TaxID=2765359 RepID=UPI0018F323BA|nr:RHS repeat protein [Rugamonas sp. CCM 8940]MBJ7313001.1 RHS repeat protein [Rugamonas sp. CCM 8940]
MSGHTFWHGASRLAFVLLAQRGAAHAEQQVVSSYQYDANGNLTKTSSALGQVKESTYDALGRQTRILLPMPAAGVAQPAITYGYDGRDQLLTVIDPRNLRTAYTNDGLGNQSVLISPDSGRTSRTFDLAGNVATVTDARGVTTTYTYDAINRVTQIAYPSDPAVSFSYDGVVKASPSTGHLSTMTDGVGRSFYSYTGLGRVNRKHQSIAPSGLTLGMMYQYGTSGGATGKTTQVTYPSGNMVLYDYDALGQVTGITLAVNNRVDLNPVSTPLLSQIEYAPFGAAVSWNWGGGVVKPYQRAFDLDGRLSSLSLGGIASAGAAADPGLTRSLSYDDAGRLARIFHHGGAGASPFDQTYSYDGLDRLTGFLATGTSQAFAYDASGNRIRATFGAASYTNTVDPGSNRLSAAAGPSPAKVYGYNAAGNMTSDGTTQFAYNDAGRMRSATNGSGTTSYLYNGMGQRVSKTGALVSTGVNYYAYDEDGHLIGEYGAGGVLIQETIYLGDQPVATLRPSASGEVGVYYIYTDQINTPRVIARAVDGKIVWRWESADPFGLQQPNENPSGQGFFTYNLRFPGQLYDKETNLHYNYFRDYDPQTGRYMQSDPIGLKGGINTYTYADAAPIVKSDPMGLATYMCTQPLHALGALGRFAYSPDSNPLFHQFIGIIRPDGSIITGGQDRTGGPWSPGTPSKGDGTAESGAECKKAEDDNECIEKCLMGKFASSRPLYALMLSGLTNNGQNCQDWAKDTLAQCQSTCKAHK